YQLEYLHVISGTGVIPSATVKLKKDGESYQDSGVGDGPVDAALAAIDAITGLKGRLQDYAIRAATSGKDALGEVAVKVDFDGTLVSGKGSSTDVIEASARAYLSALTRMLQAGGPTRSSSAPWAGPSGTACHRSSARSAGCSPCARSSTSTPTCVPRCVSRCSSTPRRSSAPWSRAPI